MGRHHVDFIIIEACHRYDVNSHLLVKCLKKHLLTTYHGRSGNMYKTVMTNDSNDYLKISGRYCGDFSRILINHTKLHPNLDFSKVKKSGDYWVFSIDSSQLGASIAILNYHFTHINKNWNKNSQNGHSINILLSQQKTTQISTRFECKEKNIFRMVCWINLRWHWPVQLIVGENYFFHFVPFMAIIRSHYSDFDSLINSHALIPVYLCSFAYHISRFNRNSSEYKYDVIIFIEREQFSFDLHPIILKVNKKQIHSIKTLFSNGDYWLLTPFSNYNFFPQKIRCVYQKVWVSEKERRVVENKKVTSIIESNGCMNWFMWIIYNWNWKWKISSLIRNLCSAVRVQYLCLCL